MDPIISTVREHFRLNTRLAVKALQDLSWEEAHRRVGGETSSALWILGHLCMYRTSVLRLLGREVDFSWKDLFQRGAGLRKPEEYPAPEELLSSFQALGEQMDAALQEVDEGRLLAVPEREFPVGEKTVRGGIAFLGWHEAYHVGQLGLIRKALCRPGLVG